MGDVFDAMNRAKRDGGSGAADAPGADAELPGLPEAALGASAVPSAPEGPSLPLAQFPSLPGDPPALSRPARGAVTAAAAKAETEAQSAAGQTAVETDADPTAPAVPGRPDPALNGYAPEVIVHHDRGCVITEQYRAVRTQLLARARSRRLQTHVITSSAPEEGKSVSTINLGVAFAELRNQKTLLMECDLRRPSFHKLFDRAAEPGLIHYLRGEVDQIDPILHPTVYSNLQYIPAGGRDAMHSTELLTSPRMAQILDRLKDRYDHILVDTPPAVTVTDACILGAMCDQVILVVRLNRTPSDLVERAKRLLRAANCDVSGVILTHNHLELARYLYRYGYGRYAYGRYYK